MRWLKTSGRARRGWRLWAGCPKKRIGKVKMIGFEEENRKEHL